jgi:uncharacterized membrane protein YiaA
LELLRIAPASDVHVDSLEEPMSFTIYLIGYIIFIIGLAVGAHLLHMPPRWIGVGVLILAGLGILSGVARTRQRDSSS